MHPIEPQRFVELENGSATDLRRLNLLSDPQCRIGNHREGQNLRFGLWINDELVMTSQDLYLILDSLDHLHDNDICSNDDISPPCRLSRGHSNQSPTFMVSIGDMPLARVASLEDAVGLVRKLRLRRLCDYGDEIYIPPRQKD